MSAPLCKDCRYYKWTILDKLLLPGKSARYAECTHPMISKTRTSISSVTGKPDTTSLRRFCSIERGFDHDEITPCGIAGKLFEPK